MAATVSASSWRESFKTARRVVVKAGTSVVSNTDGLPSLPRIGSIVEDIAWLSKRGVEVLFVTSGAVGIGRNKLRTQFLSKTSLAEHLSGVSSHVDPSALGLGPGLDATASRKTYSAACAAAGQLGLMALYDTLFATHNVPVAQLLLTASEFANDAARRNVAQSMNAMIALGVVPIINENDAVSANRVPGESNGPDSFADNDALASLVCRELDADLLIFLSDVDGVYTAAPSEPGARRISLMTEAMRETIKIGAVSTGGRGGMDAKIRAAMTALVGGPFCSEGKTGPGAVVLTSGYKPRAVREVVEGCDVGTVFLGAAQIAAATAEAATAADDASQTPVEVARAARAGGRLLASAPAAMRSAAVHALADLLVSQAETVLEANARDVAAATEAKLAAPLLARLQLTRAKLESLAAGIRAVAATPDPLGAVRMATAVSATVSLRQVSVPIGVLLVIFESRPDCLPQIAALALRSGNGLVLKGGKEAAHSNAALHALVQRAIASACGECVPVSTVGLVSTRAAVAELLQLADDIDLVIPRGSAALVQSVQAGTRIPVLGHADGVCHVYVDARADLDTALRVVVDAKTSYPAACNAAETLLLHRGVLDAPTDLATPLLRALRARGVRLHGGPAAAAAGLVERGDADFSCEYSDLAMSIEVVDSVEAAVEHINRFGSGHTDAIVTTDEAAAAVFKRRVDSACVFVNVSTRFADGQRFGLGSEVGIATGRIHARGPVGVEGLLTVQWVAESSSPDGDVVADYEGAAKARAYAWTRLPLS